jgi:hypothetical protein
LSEFYEEEKFELYNLSYDMGEKKELSKIHPRKAKELLTMMRHWQKDIGAKLPEPNPKKSQALTGKQDR